MQQVSLKLIAWAQKRAHPTHHGFKVIKSEATMRYISTRGGMPPKSFSEILLGGLAPDGGLVMPEVCPKLDLAKLTQLATLPYPELAFEIISLFVDDIPAADLKALVAKTYTSEVFGSTDITPVIALEANLYLQQLSNGPTLAFKDMAMQLLGNLFEYVLARDNRQINIVGATSGDTGSAAEYAMRGKKGVNVFMLSPAGKMSPFQRAQMFSLQEPNIHNIAVTSMFDACQDMVKAINNDADFKQKYKIGAVNSINWGRVVAQICYYFKGYFAVAKTVGEPVDFCVPSGNFGNICAGHMARQMGLPIRKLIVATNENDVLDEFFSSGGYHPRGLDRTYETSSPSMDITKASNLERFVFDLLGRDADTLADLWSGIDAGKGFQLSKENFSKMHDVYGFRSSRSTHDDRLSNIRSVFANYGREIDPHTADGFKAALEHRDANIAMVILETALPAKFEDTMVEAIGQKPQRPAALVGLEDLPQRFDVLEADVAALKAYLVERIKE
jgi:threonine synthase